VLLNSVETVGTLSQPVSPPAPPATRRSRRWPFVVGAVAVVVAAVLAVVLSGVLAPGAGNSVTLVSEGTAAATAANFTRDVPGGPWQLTSALGFLGGGPVNTSRLLPQGISCSVRNVTHPSIPAISPSASSYRGLAQAWLLDYANLGGTTGLSILVQAGAAVELGEWSGSDCEPGAPLTPPLIDSTVAATAVAASAYGSAFIADHPQANATFELIYTSYSAGGVQKNATFWILGFRAPPDESTFPLYAEVFASNGTIECVGTGSPDCPR